MTRPFAPWNEVAAFEVPERRGQRSSHAVLLSRRADAAASAASKPPLRRQPSL